MENLLLWFDLDGLKYLASLVLIALILGLYAAVEQWWRMEGRKVLEWLCERVDPE